MPTKYKPYQVTSNDDVYEFVKDFIFAYGKAPTRREIMLGMGMSSTSVASFHLERLESRNKIKIHPGENRGIELVEFPHGRYTEIVNAAQLAVLDDRNTGETIGRLNRALVVLD